MNTIESNEVKQQQLTSRTHTYAHDCELLLGKHCRANMEPSERFNTKQMVRKLAPSHT